MLSVTVTGDKEVIARFDAMSDRVHQALLVKVTDLADEIRSYVTSDKLQGQVLNHITGQLASSIHSEVQDNSQSIIGRVYSSGCNYAAIHEFGGEIPDRYPVNAKAMHWMNGAQDVFAKFARGFTMPERSYLRSSLQDYRERIISGLTDAVKEAVAKK